MTDDNAVSRRTVLRTTGLALASAGLAGCLGARGGAEQRTATPTAEPTPTPTETSGGGASDEVASFLEGANNFDGSVVDETGSSDVTVSVGAGNGLAFDPAAVRVSTGTTVTWEWTGQGGTHNVVHKDGAFDSGEAATQPEPFTHTFESAGTFLYVCEPHEMAGMKGAIVVE